MRISDWSSDVCSSDLSQHQQPDHAGWAETARMVLAGPEPAFGSSHVSARAFLPLSRAASPDRARHARPRNPNDRDRQRSEEHTSELQSLMRISYAVFCLKKKNKHHDET